jgi:hypothetical protein
MLTCNCVIISYYLKDIKFIDTYISIDLTLELYACILNSLFVFIFFFFFFFFDESATSLYKSTNHLPKYDETFYLLSVPSLPAVSCCCWLRNATLHALILAAAGATTMGEGDIHGVEQ